MGPDGATGLTGGDGSYRYKWQWDSGTGFTDFGETNRDYDPNEASFTRDAPQFFRRIVYSGKADRCVDISNVDTLIMWSRLKNNIITPPDPSLICEDIIPGIIDGSVLANGDGGDPTDRRYTWQASTDNFTTPLTIATGNGSANYQPEALTQTTWYRRIVNSSVCTDTSLPELVTVQPKIQNNNIFTFYLGTDTALCFNGDPNPLLGTDDADMTGGIGAPFSYEWLEKTTGTMDFGHQE